MKRTDCVSKGKLRMSIRGTCLRFAHARIISGIHTFVHQHVRASG